jgi:hypothetical protein
MATRPRSPLPILSASTSITGDAMSGFTRFGTVGAVKVQKFTANGTYTPSAGLLYAIVECVGGGGGGGGATGTAGNIFSGGGGGSGSYSRITLTVATIGASQGVVIGGGGNGGAAGSNNGATGSDTTLGATICVGKGGSGGLFGSLAQVPLGGAGGVSGTGDLTSAGSAGLPGFYNALNLSIAFPSGGGGASVLAGQLKALTPLPE